jgi:DNA replication protein DnaC
VTLDPLDPEQRRQLALDARARIAHQRFVARVPSRYRAASLATLAEHHGDPVLSPFRRWCESPAAALVLVGPPGVGKTFAGWAALRELASRGSVRGGNFATFLDALRPGDDDSATRLVWARLRHDAGIMLDDVGAEKLTEWAAATLDKLLDERWQESRPTIITSNLTAEGLADHVGARAWSRLTANGSLVLRLTGPDLRREHS